MFFSLLGDNAFKLFIIVRHNYSLKRISDAWEIFWTLSRGLKLWLHVAGRGSGHQKVKVMAV